MMATQDQGVGSATMKRALVVTREVNKRNGYDVFLSYHRGDAADAETLGTLNLARALRDTLKRQGVCVFFDEHEIGDFESITARLKDGVARSRSLLALYSRTCPDATRLPVRVDGRPSCGPPGGWSAPALLVVNAEAGGSRRPSGHERALVLICCDDQPTRQAVVAGAADRADVGTARGQGSLPAQQGSARPTLPGDALAAAE
jgi:hypothetical protein